MVSSRLSVLRPAAGHAWVWAALVQAALFALLHYGKPTAEIASSFFGALLLAVIARRLGSFLPGFVLHWAISIAFDVAVLYHHLGRPGGGGAR
jgi:membrane protease YdiL (CAAX protease family)